MEKSFLYLDNPASSHPKPEEVYAASDHALRLGANPGRSAHAHALDASRIVTDTRELLAKFINAEASSQIVFTLNASHALNQALKGYLKPGDHVVTTSMEHNSVLRPLYALSQSGVSYTVVRADSSGRVDPAALERAIGPKTAMVALNHASNVCGTINDAMAVGALCRAKEVAFLLDASQTLGSLPIDVKALGVDFLAAPGHKGLLGPQGTGILYVRDTIQLTPLIHGGTGFASESPRMPEEMPERCEGGTVNTPGIAGLGEGVKFLLSKGMETLRAEEKALSAYVIEKLQSLNGLALYGPCDPEAVVPVFSFNLADKDGAHVGFVLDEAFSIAVRVGLHCAPEAHKTLGTFPSGTVRAGFGPFNTRDDADRLADSLSRILKL